MFCGYSNSWFFPQDSFILEKSTGDSSRSVADFRSAQNSLAKEVGAMCSRDSLINRAILQPSPVCLSVYPSSPSAQYKPRYTFSLKTTHHSFVSQQSTSIVPEDGNVCYCCNNANKRFYLLQYIRKAG